MKLISLIFVVASLFLGGCANQHYQNMAEGTLIGGAVGALLGDSSRAARIGAGVGLLAGAAAPVRSQYGYPNQYPNQGGYPLGGNVVNPGGQQCHRVVIIDGRQACEGCPRGSFWDGRGCRIANNGAVNGYPPNTYGYPNQGAAPMPYGTYQADPRTCPRVQLPGGRWRCQ